MRFLLIACFVAAAVASKTTYDSFDGFVMQYKKHYPTKAESSLRREVFEANLKKMVEHNKMYSEGKVSWYMKVHEDMDLTPQEWMDKRVQGLPEFKPTEAYESTPKIQISQETLDKLPRDFSWVDQGGVSSVKNQAGCGSCAAFASTGAIESCYFIATGVLPDDLSEQYLLDCAYGHVYTDANGQWGASGCDGAWQQAYFDWLVSGPYWDQEEFGYPYTSGSSLTTGPCSPSDGGYNTNAYVTGMNNYYNQDESNMVNLLQNGPVVAEVAVTDSWGGYGGGVLNAADCCNQASDSSCQYQLNHAILVVGYGSEGGQDYWLIKNSWGPGWGEGGFFKLMRGTGHCGIGSVVQTQVTCAAA